MKSRLVLATLSLAMLPGGKENVFAELFTAPPAEPAFAPDASINVPMAGSLDPWLINSHMGFEHLI